MNRLLTYLVNASLVLFAVLVLAWQVLHYDDTHDQHQSIARTYTRGKQLAAISDIWKRDRYTSVGASDCRQLDLMLPNNVRIFMTDMTGPTNYSKIGNFFWITYYLFPREIATSLDHTARETKDGFVGASSESDREILSSGFDVKMNNASGRPTFKALRKFPVAKLANPDWFDSGSDWVIAFLLPLLTALAGMWLARLLFPILAGQMPLPEQLACSLGLGMMALAALELGVKLCGFSGRWLVLTVTAVGAMAEVYRDREALWSGITHGARRWVRRPLIAALALVGLVVFLLLFRVAGLEGLLDGDAMRWMLKAKIMHLYTGHELVEWFSNPALAHAHLDYPTLVPSLHAATFDSIGHVDDFVTKFWPVWMLLFLVAAMASASCAGKHGSLGASLAILGLLLLPATQKYVQWEGSTMPMIFFSVLGFGQCALWLMEKDRARLGLGLTLLFGAAMVKFEGALFLAIAVGWMLLAPSARPPLRPWSQLWPWPAFCLLSALPYFCLRLQIPVLNFESSHVGGVLAHPASFFSTLADWPRFFIVELARLFLNPAFADWSGDTGRLHWIGQWTGLASLYNPSTLGLAWLCLLMTIALWFSVPVRRRVIVWMLAMFLGATAALTGVFVSFVSLEGLGRAIGYTGDETGGRYLLPVLLAWFSTLLIVGLADGPASVQIVPQEIKAEAESRPPPPTAPARR